MRYVDTWDATSDGSGAYAQTIAGADGETRVIRADDGLRFTHDGGHLLAGVVLERVSGISR